MEQTTKPATGHVELAGAVSSGEPLHLPYSAYPQAGDADKHGVQALPASLPLVDFARARPYRSRRYAAVAATDLTPAQLLQMA